MFKPRSSATALAMDSLKTKQLTWFELAIVVPHMWWEILGLSFIIGYSNAWSFLQFGTFTTIQTGNLLVLINNGIVGVSQSIIQFQVAVILLHTVLGTFISSWIMHHFKVREQSLLIILTLIIVVASASEIGWKFTTCGDSPCPKLGLQPNKLPFSGLPIITLIGSLAHWTSKLGFILPYQTGNMMAEIHFKIA